MKYIYISCLVLSSLFTYKQLSAKDYPLDLAFFVPQGTFQKNTATTDIELMRPRQIDSSPAPVLSTQDWQDSSEETSESTSQRAPKAPKISLPYVKKQIRSQKKTVVLTDTDTTTQQARAIPKKDEITRPNNSDTQSASSTAPQPEIDNIIKQKLNKYSLDTLPTNTQKKQETTAASTFFSENIRQKSLNELLSSIPLPDFNQPKFKQLYASYGMELRVLHRRGKLPYNTEQEKNLAKANSVERRKIK